MTSTNPPPRSEPSISDEQLAYKREAYQRFFAHVGQPWPGCDAPIHDAAIALAERINSLEAERQQTGMRPAQFRVRMHQLLLAELQQHRRSQERAGTAAETTWQPDVVSAIEACRDASLSDGACRHAVLACLVQQPPLTADDIEFGQRLQAAIDVGGPIPVRQPPSPEPPAPQAEPPDPPDLDNVQVALEEAPDWWRECALEGHETQLAEQPRSRHGHEYFCSDCSRAEYPTGRFAQPPAGAQPAQDVERFRVALLSIANNSCCTPCREARLVARNALGLPTP